MHCFLHFWKVIVFLCIIFGTWIISWNHMKILESYVPDSIVLWCWARWGVDAVLIYFSKFIVNRITISIITFFWCFFWREIAVLEDRFVGVIRYHRMAPPICDSSNPIIVAISHSISHLQFSYYKQNAKYH